jgi:hypothetical protein
LRHMDVKSLLGKLTMKPWTVLVSPTFDPPIFYETATVEEVEEALRIGAFVQKHVSNSRNSGNVHAFQQRAEAELNLVREQKEDEIARQVHTVERLRKELQQLRDTMRESVQQARKEEAEKQMLEIELLQRRIEAAEERQQTLLDARDAEIAKAEERVRLSFQQTLAIREEQVRAAQEALRALETAYKTQVDELRSLNEFVRRKTTNVKVKGNQFEAEIREHLVRAFGIFPGFAILDTAKGVGHAGDFLVQLGEHQTLWEVKHYDKPVPKAEVDKFRRDMMENPAVRVGVMISKSTDIVGKTGKRDHEFCEGKLLLFLTRFEEVEEPVDLLQSLLTLFEIWWEVQREEEAVEVFQDAFRELEKVLGELTKRRQEWRVHRTRMEETIRWMSDAVEEAEGHVESLVKRIRSGHASPTLEIPPLFRDVPDDKLRDTIATLLQVYKGGEGDVKLNDLADVLAAKKNLSKSTARQHVLAALQDSAVVALPGKPTLVRGLVPLEKT